MKTTRRSFIAAALLTPLAAAAATLFARPGHAGGGAPWREAFGRSLRATVGEQLIIPPGDPRAGKATYRHFVSCRFDPRRPEAGGADMIIVYETGAAAA